MAEAIELQPPASLAPITVTESAEALHRDDAVPLAPVDTGFHAWLFVFASFVLECLIWGVPLSFGVFQEWYLTHPPFQNASEASVNAIGTTVLAIQYLEGIFMVALAKKYPAWINSSMWAALATCVASLVLASFANQVWQLILLQGVVYGVAGGALYTPVILWLSEWFVVRRSFAAALIFGGTGLGGAVFPLLSNFLLEKTGFRWTLRVLASLIGVFGSIAVLGVKPRLPIAPVSRPRLFATLDLKFLTSPVFFAVGITVFLQGLAYFSVSLYIPTYAAALGYNRTQGTVALTAFNLATAVGQILFGYYCDRAPYTRVMILSGLTSCALALTLWGWAHELALVFVFVVLFGSISGGFSSIFSPASAELSKNQPMTPFMFFGGLKGLSAIIGPLIAAALHPLHLDHSAMPLTSGANGWGGFGFTAITIFVGSMMAATTFGSVLSSVLRRVFSSSRIQAPRARIVEG